MTFILPCCLLPFSQLHQQSKPFPDLGHTLLPDLSSATLGSDSPASRVVRALPFVPTALLLLALAFSHDKRALTAARTWMWSHASIIVLRSAAFALTLLPAAAPLCRGGGYGCFLRILSLETSVAWLSTLTVIRFFPGMHWTSKLLALAVGAAVPLVSVASRATYSFEALLGAWLSREYCASLKTCHSWE